MPQLKISWSEFVYAAMDRLKKRYPELNDSKVPTFIIARTDGEGNICEDPDFVYLELT